MAETKETPKKPDESWVKALPRDVWYVGGALVGLLIAAIVWFSMPHSTGATVAGPADPQTRVASGKLPGRPSDMALGSPDAPVQVVEYASLTCPHCAAFMVGRGEKKAIFPEIKAKYIDTGKVHWILREFPLNYADMAAYYGLRCAFGANAQRYFAGAGVIFARQTEWLNVQTEKEAVDNLAGIMREFGLGQAQFNACITADPAQKQLSEDREVAQKTYKVDSTPTFIINGAKYAGELELSRFEAILAPLLPKG